MLFNSAIFMLFIAVVFPLYWIVRHSTSRKWLLLIASYLFYANWDWRYLGLLFLSTLVDSIAAREMGATERSAKRRAWLVASLVTNLGILAIFKYGNLFIGTLDPVWHLLGFEMPRLPGEIPVGISFYTFQTLSYTIDVYRRKIEPCRSPLDFAMYVAFFPQLVAGPIVRAKDFLPQVRQMRSPELERVAEGIQRFLWGLFKKMVIADNVALYVDTVFAEPSRFGAVTLWCGAAAFALQIYCDFSGYTDMALGLGKAFGIRLPENFNAPYLSRSITEFWRRWHMSLSTWLRDYLYIPLGGSRGSKWFTYRNLMITMALGGLWHGAAWTFVLWGIVQGVFLTIERSRNWGREDVPDYLRSPGDCLRALFTFMLVCVSWVIFRSESFESLGVYVQGMFLHWSWLGEGEWLGLRWLGVLALLMVGQQLSLRYRWSVRVWDRLPSPVQGLVMACGVLAVAMFRVDEIAFIYFQF